MLGLREVVGPDRQLVVDPYLDSSHGPDLPGLDGELAGDAPDRTTAGLDDDVRDRLGFWLRSRKRRTEPLDGRRPAPSTWLALQTLRQLLGALDPHTKLGRQLGRDLGSEPNQDRVDVVVGPDPLEPPLAGGVDLALAPLLARPPDDGVGQTRDGGDVLRLPPPLRLQLGVQVWVVPRHGPFITPSEGQ
ncbi:MAG: hypothetical protein HC828_04020 [Blastochloris sp.]|nr:hypothetical protein [Blastochloris sp.]